MSMISSIRGHGRQFNKQSCRKTGTRQNVQDRNRNALMLNASMKSTCMHRILPYRSTRTGASLRGHNLRRDCHSQHTATNVDNTTECINAGNRIDEEKRRQQLHSTSSSLSSRRRMLSTITSIGGGLAADVTARHVDPNADNDSLAVASTIQENSSKKGTDPGFMLPGSLAAMPLAIGLVVLYSKTVVEKGEEDVGTATQQLAANTVNVSDQGKTGLGPTTTTTTTAATSVLKSAGSVPKVEVAEKTGTSSEQSDSTVTAFVREKSFVKETLVDTRPLRQSKEAQLADSQITSNVITAREWIDNWRAKSVKGVEDTQASEAMNKSVPQLDLGEGEKTLAVRQWIDNWRANGNTVMDSTSNSDNSSTSEQVESKGARQWINNWRDNSNNSNVESEMIDEEDDILLNVVAEKVPQGEMASNRQSKIDTDFKRRLERTSEIEVDRLRSSTSRDVIDDMSQNLNSRPGADMKSASNDLDLSRLDYERLFKYVLATGAQFAAWCITFSVLNVIPSTISSFVVPKRLMVAALFLFLSFRSRVFSLLDNRRPSVASEAEERKTRKRPSWTPPPLAFPIIWSSIGILRTVSSVVVWETCSRNLLASPLLALLLHLCIGDTWNNINNVEKEYGMAVSGVCMVFVSVLSATLAYYKANPVAGLILLPSCIWIGIATCLVYSIWKINGGQEPLLPLKSIQTSMA